MYFYEKLGIYSLIAQISNGKFLDDYVESRIGELIKADQMQEGGLCETLETYLAHNCNANAAAEYLFIHRNTMRYRMDKIKRILDDDINDMEVFGIKACLCDQTLQGKQDRMMHMPPGAVHLPPCALPSCPMDGWLVTYGFPQMQTKRGCF